MSIKDGYWRWSPCRSQERGDSWWLCLWFLSYFKGMIRWRIDADLDVVLGGFFWLKCQPLCTLGYMIQFDSCYSRYFTWVSILPLGRWKGVKVFEWSCRSRQSVLCRWNARFESRAIALLSIMAWRTYHYSMNGLIFRLWGYQTYQTYCSWVKNPW